MVEVAEVVVGGGCEEKGQGMRGGREGRQEKERGRVAVITKLQPLINKVR